MKTFSSQITRSRQRGNTVLEMAIIFLPLLLGTFSTFEVTRGMWMYHTLSAAIKSGTRYGTVHGADCLSAYSSCPATVKGVVGAIQQAGIGLDSSQLQLTLTAAGSTYTCASLSSCTADSTQWPPTNYNATGLPLTIRGVYSFRSIISSLWPGQTTASFTYTAEATENIQF
jgi:Flp pilus assembly protein TadG